MTLDINEVWCDYVFDETHNRMSYQEKEKFFKQNKHLQGVSSAKQIEEDGLDIAKTMTGITMNVEENSLDIIALYKMLEDLKNENKELKNEIKALKK